MRRLALALSLLTGLFVAASTASAASMKPDLDVRQQSSDPVAVAAPPAVARARDELRRSLGTQGIVSSDPADGMQTIARTDGFLTEPSAADNVDVARAYLADQRVALGLSADDLAGLRLVRTAPMGSGASVFHFAQTVDGIPAYDAELAVAVDARGRVISVTGATQRDLSVPSTTPTLSEAQAIEAARADAGVPSAGRDSSARLTIFPADGHAVLAWRVLLMVDDVIYDDVVDATTGALLVRHGLVDQATNGLVFPGWPGNPVTGGTQALENFTPWLASSTALEGDNAHVWADTDADSTPEPSEEQAPNPSGDYDDPYTTFANPTSGSTCGDGGCSWDSAVPYSWQANVKQNATQVFSYVNRFHDWLEAPPFNFTPANGNFEGDDPVNALTDYGADTDNGRPTSDYRNNANMGTPPDGQSPTMRMYLFFGNAKYHDANGGDDAFVIYHEYTHGLSNRLVVDGQGVSTISGAQGGAMGEAWSDWYAFDYLVDHGYAIDDPSDPGSLPLSPVVGPVRTEPADCPVTPVVANCPGGNGTAGAGGYTYGDFGKVISFGPEVHADGEIWAQTLWDLRRALIAEHGSSGGATRARLLVTRAMQLASARPSFLDMRNAILQADTTFQSGEDHDLIWEVFRTRGMGYFASTTSTYDVQPLEDFSLPPSDTGTIDGQLVQSDGSSPAGARITVGSSSYADSLSAVTDSDGKFTLTVPAGTYPRVALAVSNGIDPVDVTNVVVPVGGTADVTLTSRRDWAASAGGASAETLSGGDLSGSGLGVDKLIDQGPGGWVSAIDTDDVVQQIDLPRAVDVTQLTIDPTSDPLIAAAFNPARGVASGLGDYRVETSTDGTTWNVAATSTFTAADQGAARTVALATDSKSAVHAVRLIALSNAGHQAPSPSSYVSATELSVYGTPTPAPPTPGGGGGTTPEPPATPPAPEPGPQPTPFPPPTAAPTAPAAPAAPAAPTLLPTAQPTLNTVARSGLPLALRCPATCRARVEVRVGGRRAALANRSLRAGTTRLHVRLPKAVIAQLRQAKGKPRVQVRVTLRSGGTTKTITRRISLRR